MRFVYLVPSISSLCRLSIALGMRGPTAVLRHDIQQPPSPYPPSPTQIDSEFELHKRDNGSNICGYVSGSSENPFTCAESSTCVTYPDVSAVGCCQIGVTHCWPATKCLDSTAYEEALSSGPIPSSTNFCPSSTAPYCMPLVYVGDEIPGFSALFDCGTVPLLEILVAATPTTGPLTTPATLSGASDTSTSMTTSTTTTPPPTPTPTASPRHSDVGAIVGGVVGGLAAIALIILGVFLILRSGRDKPAAQSIPAQPITNQAVQEAYKSDMQYPPQELHGNQQYGGGFQQGGWSGHLVHEMPPASDGRLRELQG